MISTCHLSAGKNGRGGGAFAEPSAVFRLFEAENADYGPSIRRTEVVASQRKSGHGYEYVIIE